MNIPKLAGLLDDLSVTIIVIDDQIPPEFHRSFQVRPGKLVASEDHKWELIGSYPRTLVGLLSPNSLHILCSASNNFPYRLLRLWSEWISSRP
jgi:hypothetical protein